MAESSGARSVMPHPPAGVPKYFDSSPYQGAPVAGAAGRSRALELYEALAPVHFVAIPAEISGEELAWLEAFHRERVLAEREERRMHFGAFALVSGLFFLLLPALVAQEFGFLALDLLALLLLVLIVPYVFVYFGYENRVRAMTLGLFRLVEARAKRAEAEGKGTAEGRAAGGAADAKP